jgi:hypothetical protein
MRWTLPRRRRAAQVRSEERQAGDATLAVPRAAVSVPDVARMFPRPPGQISLVLPVSASCPICGSALTEEVPLVLDEIERPDLWLRACAGMVARFACPNGHLAPNPDVSCLLRDRTGALTFVAGDAVATERWHDEAAQLLGALCRARDGGQRSLGRPRPRDDAGQRPDGPRADARGGARRGAPVVRRGRDAGTGAMTGYQQTGQPAALDAAVAAWNAVLSHPVFPSAPAESRAAVLLSAGTARSLRTHAPLGTRRNAQAQADLDAAVRNLRGAFELLPVDARHSPRSNLILALGERYERRQRLDDLDELIGLLHDEAGDASLDPDDTGRARSELAHRRWQRFGRRRDITDLDAAIANLRALLDADPEGDRGRLAIMLGMCLMERHGAVGGAHDLDEALERIEEGAAEAASAQEWNEVANARLRASATEGSEGALDGAIDAFKEALKRSEGDRDRPGYLGNLANAHLQRWDHAHDPQDLGDAIDAYDEALELEEALEAYTMAVVDSPASSLIAAALINLARALLERGRDDDRARANDLLDRLARAIEATDAETALFAARLWGDVEVEQERWERAGEAYRRAQDAIDELVSIQLGRHYKEARLSMSGDVGARAALAFALAARPRDAAQALERSRARLLSDALEREQIDLDELAARGRGDLVERYEQAAAAIP